MWQHVVQTSTVKGKLYNRLYNTYLQLLIKLTRFNKKKEKKDNILVFITNVFVAVVVVNSFD